jgi:S-DNA-T family DNA segregation ATPase FtsK/SpoIIIE
LLGSGKYAAGIRATELRINADRGTCVAVGVTDEVFELVRTFYVPFEDGTDDVTPVIARSLALLTEGTTITATTEPENAPAVTDPLADIAAVIKEGERRVRTQTVLTRLAALHPDTYEGWAFADLAAVLARHGVAIIKSHGNKVIRAEDIATVVTQHNNPADNQGDEHDHHNNGSEHDGDPAGDPTGTRGLLPTRSPHHNPPNHQQKRAPGTLGTPSAECHETRRNKGLPPHEGGSLPADSGGSG